ncbi:MAG: response regulator [Oligoflexales bacterium]
MLNESSKVAVCLSDRRMIDLVTKILVARKLVQVIQFQSVDEAFEILSRQQVDLIVVGLELLDHPGVTLMQRLRETGNYGLEPFFFIGNDVDPQTLRIFLEYDVDYILTAPIDEKSLVAKVDFLLENENSVSPEIQLYRDAKSAVLSGLAEMAESFAEQLLNHGKLHVKALLIMVDVALLRGDYDKAEQYVDEAEGKDPYSVSILNKKSHVYRCQKKMEEAKECLDILAAENPMHLKVLERAGLTNLDLGHFDLAQQQMKNLQLLDKNNQAATETLAHVDMEQGHFEGVSERLRKNHTEKEVVSILNTAGVKLSKQKDFEGAISIYKDCLEVITKKEFVGKIHYNIALGYRGLVNYKLCLRHCSRALEAYPGFEKAKNLTEEIRKKME